jgi:hypothetical protein
MVFGSRKPYPSDARIARFAKDDNDQDDVSYFQCMRVYLGKMFTLFGKSVCFTNLKNKRSFKSELWHKICVPISTFKVHCNPGWLLPQVAVVEGTIGHVKNKRGQRFGPAHWGEFHSCLVIVDSLRKCVYVFNPWKEGLLRSRNVRRVTDIRPYLVQRLVNSYDNYDIYHYSGMQTTTSDCRIHLLEFAKRLGILKGKFREKINWKQLRNCGKRTPTGK